MIPKVAVTKVESGLQPLRGDPGYPLKETNAIGQARALRIGLGEELSLSFFRLGETPFRQPSPTASFLSKIYTFIWI